MSDHRWPTESIDENGERFIKVWVNGEWHDSRNLAQNSSSTSQSSQYTRPIYSRDQPTVSSPSYSQGYSTSQSYSTGQNQPTYLPVSSQGYSDTSQTYDTSQGYGTSQDYSAQPASQGRMSSMNVDTSYMQGRAPIPSDSGRRDTSYAPGPAPIQYQTGYTSSLTGRSQMFEEPEEMDLSTSAVPSEAMFASRRPGSASGSGGSSRPFNFDYRRSMDSNILRCPYELPVVDPITHVSNGSGATRTCNAIAEKGIKYCTTHRDGKQLPLSCQTLLREEQEYTTDSAGYIRGLEPKLKQMVRLPSGAFINPRCDNSIITEQFYCLNCRPDLLRCSFQLSNPNVRLCDRVGQPEHDPVNASMWPRVYQDFWNCPDHKTHVNQGACPPAPARRPSSTSYGYPEPGLEMEEPALFQPPPSSRKSGATRAEYYGGKYMHKGRKFDPTKYTKQQWQAKLEEEKAEDARMEREREHNKRESGRHRKSTREQDGETNTKKHRHRHSK
ncbi:hypothetical protein BCON_0128g00220 [Botryotinia convoluta]|uniref:Uncharacterized protein n=1 Tax=Botryotinia convoluta TaxID=54673 RepID=A0A4Z1HWU3_9HELO|nr:hypothetical protein BCON_0128g00220 [Botryotinia convoluta]